jgi:homoserine dehydrogenase
VRVAVLGCGTVGAPLVEALLVRPEEIAARAGVRLELVGVAVNDLRRPRSVEVPPDVLTADAKGLVQRADVDVVVELIGGLDPARTLVEAALRSGSSVVTGNKTLLAAAGGALADLAAAHGVDLLYEAAVGGAIPVIRPLRESLAGERILRVTGIVNGTTNFILTQMTEAGRDYRAALAEAQRLGLAERDPTADVEGHDAAAKAAILAMLAFGIDVAGDQVHREGITHVRADDVAFATRLGYVVKLLAVAERIGDGPDVSVRVHPAMVPSSHPLAAVRGAFNAVFIEGEASGPLMLYGQGAGGVPSASAVLGDLVDAARTVRRGSPGPAPRRHRPGVLRPVGELRSAFYLSLDVADRPGVLAAVATVFGDHGVSIRAMEQVGLDDEARLIFLTHVATDGDVQATIADLEQLPAVDRVGGVLRVVAEDPLEVDGPPEVQGPPEVVEG